MKTWSLWRGRSDATPCDVVSDTVDVEGGALVFRNAGKKPGEETMVLALSPHAWTKCEEKK